MRFIPGGSLAGVGTDEVTDVSVYPDSITSTLHKGRADAQPPATRHFWVAQASSTHTAAINWKIRDGRYRVVIMSAHPQNQHTSNHDDLAPKETLQQAEGAVIPTAPSLRSRGSLFMASLLCAQHRHDPASAGGAGKVTDQEQECAPGS